MAVAEVSSRSQVSDSDVSSPVVISSHSDVVVTMADSASDIKDCVQESVAMSVQDSLISSPSSLGTSGLTETPTLQGLLSHPVAVSGTSLTDAIQIITVANPVDFMSSAPGGVANRVWQIVPGSSPEVATIVAVQHSDFDSSGLGGQADCNEVSSMSEPLPSLLMSAPPPPAPHVLPPQCPAWAARLKCCEQIGDSYRGYVDSEVELDLLLTYHKQQTQSFWGTRQSPSQSRVSTRLMWKSQYVPFDGIPFINSGSRAVVMECQYGPRRKGCPQKKDGVSQQVVSLGGLEFPARGTLKAVPEGSPMFRKTCPARIYIKRVKKFPQFAVDPNMEKKHLKAAMDKSFQALRGRLLDVVGQERFYVQLPTEDAHEFHQATGTEEAEESSQQRLHPQVINKIREMVAGGETRLYAVRKAVRNFVSRELFNGQDETPERHDLTYYPTVNDLKNHIHSALADIENGTLALTAPTVNLEVMPNGEQEVMEIKQVDNTIWPPTEEGDGPTPETVTVTLTQHPGEDGHHVISRIETHLSDGTTEISDTLTPETAQILSNLHPAMFPSGCANLLKLQPNRVSSSDTSDAEENEAETGLSAAPMATCEADIIPAAHDAEATSSKVQPDLQTDSVIGELDQATSTL